MRDDLAGKLRALDEQGLRRRALVLESASGPEIEVDGRKVLNLSSNDYLGLASHPDLVDAVATAAHGHGAGAGGARLVTGTHEAHVGLEREIASFLGTERALLFGSGYLANLGAVTALASGGGTVLSDERNHASLVDACRLARAEVLVYEHRDVEELGRLLARSAPPRIVITESVFSMDGDRGPLDGICAAAREHGAWVYVDEAHAFGHLGPGGRGLSSEPGVASGVHARMGTLGKALGSYGAFVAGTEELAEYLTSTARTFLYSTALPLPVVAAARAALAIVASARGDALRERLSTVTGVLQRGLAEQGWEVLDVPGPILPIMVGDPQRAVRISESLLERGVLVRAMRWPTVKPGTERLRMVSSAALTDQHLDRALEAMEKVRKRMP